MGWDGVGDGMCVLGYCLDRLLGAFLDGLLGICLDMLGSAWMGMGMGMVWYGLV